MRKIAASIVALAASAVIASDTNSVFHVKREFFDALRFVESTDGKYLGDQDGGRSHGPYQISAAYLQDAGECPHSELVGQILAAADKQNINLLDLCKEDPFVSGRSDDDSNT